MRQTLDDQVAIVTGGSRGIGRAIALRLAEAGCHVAAIARSRDQLDATAELATAAGFLPILPVSADITNDGGLEAAVRLVLQRLGHVAILVNNAGIAPPRTAVVKTSLAEWDRTLSTCLRAPMVLTRLVLPDMLAHHHGAIINIASIAAKRARAGEAAYVAAKLGLVGFTQALYEEVRNHGIKVCAICPGLVDTALVPPNKHVDRAKFLQPADIANLVYDVLTSPVRTCPTEIVIEPQFDPEARG